MNDPTGSAPRPPALPSFTPGPESQASRILRRARPSLKLLTLLFLLLLLLIPLARIRGVLHERRARQGEAIRDITAAWGGQQVLAGPVLVVPYRYTFTSPRTETVNGVVTTVERRETAVAEAFFLPEQLDVRGELAPEVRYRGIYEAVVYKGRFTVSGRFHRPSFEDWKIPPQDILWEEAVVSMSITDLRGVQEGLRLTLGDRDLPLVPGSRLPGFPSGVHARVRDPGLAGPETIPFSMNFTLNGSMGVRFAPMGIGNTVKVSSAWSDPSFRGSYLPASSDIRPDGFSADWAMSYYGRAYPQQWISQKGDRIGESAIEDSLFGVDLLSLVDQYRNVERSIKYGSLFLLLVFTGFFLFETLGGVRIHPFQYILVGAALCLFYLALLSLSELTAFRWAYLAGAAASTLLITLYCARVLRGGRRALIIAAELVLIYGFLYVILQLQDYSLLIGTVGLFVALGAVMFLTRKINWYEAGEGPGASKADRP